MVDLRDGTLQIWWGLLHGPRYGTSRVKFDERIYSFLGDGFYTYKWWILIRCGLFHKAHWYQISWTTCCRWYEGYFMDLGMVHLYGDGFLIKVMLWEEPRRKNWWQNEDVHSYGLSMTIGLITLLVQIMVVDNLQRFVSIVFEYHGRSSHDEMTHHGNYCIIYVAWMFAIYRLIQFMDQEGSTLWRTHTNGLCGIGMDILVINGCWDGRFFKVTMTSSGGRFNATKMWVVLTRAHDGGAWMSQEKWHRNVEENARPLVKLANCGDGQWYIGEGDPRWRCPTKRSTCIMLIWRAEWVVGRAGSTC